MIVGSGVLAVLVVGAFAVLLVAMSHLQRSTNEQARARNVTAATLSLERVVNELEAGLRSFAIGNGNNRLLGSWRQGRAELPAALDAVEKANEGEPMESNEIRQLGSLIHAYIDEYGLPLIQIARVRPDVPRSHVASQEGFRRINTIRRALTNLLSDDDTLASADAAAAKVESTEAVRIGVAALVAAAGLLALFGIFIARGIARPVRTVADGASRVASGDFSTRMPEGGAAEIATLTRSFNAMARSLEQGKRELENQNEELRESERQMSQLVSIVSHELRTPLAAILGYTSVLLNRDVSRADATHYLEIIREQGKRLESLVDEFLAGESVKAGRIELKDDPVDLKPLLVAESDLLAHDAPKHRIEVEIHPDALPVRGDRDRIAQVFTNLLTNAVKYSPNGGLVEVQASIEGGVVRVLVRDRGLGVPDEHQSQIFTKFYRGDARQSGITGTGLGLAVSREIIEAHGGHIGFTSEAGSGSAFWFELPADRDALDQIEIPSAPGKWLSTP
ncbi:MAG TPA: ATP-binding protein [Gaiellaceae bacterium]